MSCLLKTSSTNDLTSALFVDKYRRNEKCKDLEQKSRHNRQSIDRNRNIAMGISESEQKTTKGMRSGTSTG